MKLQPLHDWAVIRQFAAEEMTASGLYIPDMAKEKSHEGVVVAIGPGAYEEEKRSEKKDKNKERRFIPTTIKPGDLVIYERYAGRAHTIDNDELVLVRERDILGVLLERPIKTSEQKKPLQIPATTSSQQSTASILKRPVFPLAKTSGRTATQKTAESTVGKTEKKPAKKKTAKKTAKKTVKPAAKKSKPGSARSGKTNKKR